MDTVEIFKFMAATRDLIYAVLVLNALLIIIIGIHAVLLLKRLYGAANNGGEPYDPVTNKTFNAEMAKLDQGLAKRTEEAVSSVTNAVDTRFISLGSEQGIQRKKMNTLLIIMRDIRAFMIYGQRPATDLPPIEEDES